MKKIGYMVLLALFCVSSVALANPEIQKKHKGLKKDGKMINCGYCHTSAKIKKEKGYGIALVNKNSMCMGAGCHPIK